MRGFRICIVSLSWIATESGILWKPSECSSALLQQINTRSISALRLLLFFKQITLFDQLNVEDRILLTKHHLMPLVILNGALNYREDVGQVLEVEQDVPWNMMAMQEFYGNEICLQIEKNFQRFLSIARHDRRIMLLALVILIFTPARSVDVDSAVPLLNDNLAVYRAQSHYAELLWKYVETVHGSKQTVKTFQELVINFIAWRSMDNQIRNSIRHALAPSDVDGMIPLMKSLLNLV